MTIYTVDTGVLAWAADNECQNYLEAVSFLANVLDGNAVAVDYRGAIIDEYRRHSQGYAKRWLAKALTKLHFRDDQVPKRIRQHLLERLSFHNNDLKFVGVASRTKDKLLVIGQDEDYSEPVKTYLTTNLGVTVKCCLDG